MADASTTTVVNLFRLNPGVDPESFATFSASIDQPTLLEHSDVVHRFEVFLVAEADRAELAADVVELLEVSSWPTWEQLRDGSPSIAKVLAGLDGMVDPDSVRTTTITQIRKRATA